MSLWSDITSAIGSVFGGGNNSQPSSSPNDPRRKQNTAPTVSPVINQGIHLPTPMQASGPMNLGPRPVAPPKPVTPIFNMQPVDNSNLTAQHASLFHNLTHNVVTDAVGSVAKLPVQLSEDYSNTFANLGNKLGGGKDQTIQQNMGGNAGLTPVLKWSGATGTNKQLAGDAAQAGLMAVAPAADKFIANPITDKLLASGASRVGTRFIANTAAGAPVLSAFNAASAVGNGADANQTLTAALQGAATAPAFAAGGEFVRPVIKAIRGRTATPSDITTPVAPEVSEGVTVTGEPTTPPETPPETGTKAPTEPAPTNAPTSEPTNPISTTPNAPESGIKPVTPPPTVTPRVPTQEQFPLGETKPTPVTPPQAVAPPADVAAEQAAIQQAVDKTATTPPTSVAPPETAAPNVAPSQTASEAVAASPEQQVVNEAPNVPRYNSPHKNGKASVPGNSQARYSTGDPNLDGIVNDSLIAHKGTAATAGTRADALDKAGITSAQRAQIRNIATKNVDRNTGKISASGVKQIEDVIKGPAEAPKVTPAETPAAVPAEAPPEPTPQVAPASEPKTPTSLEKTGDPMEDLNNAAQAVHDRIENPADFTGNKNAQELIDEVNGRGQGHGVVAKELHARLDEVLTKEQQANVTEALQTGKVNELTGDERQVAEILQQHLNNPADVLRSTTDKNYVSGDNYSTQIRQGGVKSAAKTANNMGGSFKNKVSNFNDLLQQSRFSQARTLGKFTSGNVTKVGDPADLGLVAKKDGTFVDKAGKVYDYSHATNKELENAGTKLQGLSNSTHTYAKDTMTLADRTSAADEMIKNPEKYGLSDTATENNQPSVNIKGSDGESREFFTDKGTQKALQEAGVTTGGIGNKTNLATSIWNKATTGIVQSIVMNPTVHSMNQLVQGMVASGLRSNGLTGLSFLKDSLNHSIDDVVAAHDAGVYVPTYGKNIETVLSKMTFGGSKLNEKAMSAIDGNFRVGAFKSLTKGGMDPKEAAATVNRFMGDRSVFKDAQPQMGMFMHYFVTMNKSAGSTLAQAVKGHPGGLTNAAIAAGATYGLQQAWQKFTGNQNASVHAPGMVGIAKDYAKSAEALAQGHYRDGISPITNRINPLVTQGAEQILGVNNFGTKFKNGAARVDNALAMSPLTNAVANNGHSFGEKAANTFGLTTPHIKGDMAVSPNNPLAPVLNVNGAKNGSTVAFPQDFTGRQASDAVNNSGLQYSSKTAAQFSAQPQSDQQAITKTAADFKSVGITNPQQIFEASKLSSSEQNAYKQAATQLNQAGKATSSKAIQEQLLANGNKDLAGKLNTGAPGSTYNAQRALDTANFAKSGQKSQSIDGLHFEATSDPNKPQVMEQKDYDYKQATDAITSAKNSGSVSSYQKGNQNLLSNIGWQLKHADLTPSQKDALVQKAVQTQEDYAKIAYQGNNFKAPKGVKYQTPQINGDYTYTPEQQKAYGVSPNDGYLKQIQTAGAKYGVDINALVAIASQEGLGGGVGDNGTSFGPFQMHEGGALPAGKDQAWAESPAGIDYAVQQIKNVVGNKTGADAIKAIATGFEKSTDPQGEAARALALYEGGAVNLGSAGSGLTSQTSGSDSGSGSGSSSKNNLPNGNAVVMPSNGTGLTASAVKYVAPKLAVATAGSSKNGNPFVHSISAAKGVK